MKLEEFEIRNLGQAHFLYWQTEDIRTVENAECISELTAVAERILKNYQARNGAHLVVGPLTTEHDTDVEKNLLAYRTVIEYLMFVNNFPVFSQLPFEIRMAQMESRWHETQKTTRETSGFMKIVSKFYTPLFDSGMVVHVHFMSDYGDTLMGTALHRYCRVKVSSTLHEPALRECALRWSDYSRANQSRITSKADTHVGI